MKKQGFTLIELLAIIIMLGILILIAVPSVSNIIEQGKKDAFITSAQGLAKAAYTNCSSSQLLGEIGDGTLLIKDYKKTFGIDLDFDGDLPQSGVVNIDEKCRVELAVENEKWCVRKLYKESDVQVYDKDDFDCTLGYNSTRLIDVINDKSSKYLFNENETNNKFIRGENANNYILFDNKKFQVLGTNLDYGTLVVGYLGDESDFYIDNGQYFIQLNERFSDPEFALLENSPTVPFDIDFYKKTIDELKFDECMLTSTFDNCKKNTWIKDGTGLLGFETGESVIRYYYVNNNEVKYDNLPPNLASLYFGSIEDHVTLLREFNNIKNISATFVLDKSAVYISGDGSFNNPYVYEKKTYKEGPTDEECFLMTKDGKGIRGYKYTSSSCPTNIVIPNKINNVEVEYIEREAFSNGLVPENNNDNDYKINKIASGYFSSYYGSLDLRETNIKIIKSDAFTNSIFEGPIYLNEGLKTIESYAFYRSNITGQLIIPSTVETIGYSAFERTHFDTLLFKENSNLIEIGDEAFYNMNNLTGTVTFPEGLSVLKHDVFGSTGLSTIVLPSTIKKVGSGFVGRYNYGTDLEIIIKATLDGLDPEFISNLNNCGQATKFTWLNIPFYNVTANNNTIIDKKRNAHYYVGFNYLVTSEEGLVTSFELNGNKITGNTFTMPSLDVVIGNPEIKTIFVLESDHPYTNNLNKTYTQTIPGAASIKLTFSADTIIENSYDKIYITDKNGNIIGGSTYFTGSSLAGKTFNIPGDTVNIRLTTDGSVTNYGFYAEIMKGS